MRRLAYALIALTLTAAGTAPAPADPRQKTPPPIIVAFPGPTAPALPPFVPVPYPNLSRVWR